MRLASYAQESTRYCDYGGSGIQLIHPDELDDKQRERRERLFWKIQNIYEIERSEGLPPQIARGVLPTCLKTEIVMTANFREWRHFIKLRAAGDAHPQIRPIAKTILQILMAHAPAVFVDLLEYGE